MSNFRVLQMECHGVTIKPQQGNAKELKGIQNRRL